MLRSLMKILGSTARCVAISVVLVLLASVTSGAMVQTRKHCSLSRAMSVALPLRSMPEAWS